MTQRRLVIEPAVISGSRSVRPLTVEVCDEMPIGACVASLAAQFGYPLTDTFGTPIPYRLRPATGGPPLSNTGRFAHVRFRSGSRFVLETAQISASTVPFPVPERASPKAEAGPPERSRPPSRRSFLLAGGIGGLASLSGLLVGAATSYAQRAAQSRARASARLTSPTPAPTRAPVQLALQTRFAAHQSTVAALAWEPTSTQLASGGTDQQVLIWHPDTTILHTVVVSGTIGALAWSPQGRSLAVGFVTTVAFLDAQTAEVLARHPGAHTAPVTALAWTSAAGQVLALSAAQDRRAIVWDGATFAPVLAFTRHTAPILALAALSETAATSSEGGVVRLWNVLSGQEVHGYFSDGAAAFLSLSWATPSPLLAVGGADGMVRLWQEATVCTTTGQDAFGVHCLDAPQILSGATHPISALSCSPDGTLLATGGDEGILRLFSLREQRPVLSHPIGQPIAALAFSPSGSLLAIAAGAQVTLWHLQH